ncbi:hypothetical protein [Kribbella sp. NPDC051770]|uniref:hypothetical protein n=1 Tax=Kribbella sp. NPDC051770 TaxID=3155413 RepID=UPI00343DED10
MPNSLPLHCRVCGLPQLTPPWGDDGKSPTFEICDCCGTEFGYDDATPAGITRARARWKASGFQWFTASARPEGWNADAQLPGQQHGS